MKFKFVVVLLVASPGGHTIKDHETVSVYIASKLHKKIAVFDRPNENEMYFKISRDIQSQRKPFKFGYERNN